MILYTNWGLIPGQGTKILPAAWPKQKTLPVKISMWFLTHTWTLTDTDSKGVRLDRTKGKASWGQYFSQGI